MLNTMNNFSNLLENIDAFIRKYYLDKVFRGVIWWLSLLLFCSIFLIVIEYFSYFKPQFRTVLVYSFLSAQVLFFWIWVGRHLLKYFRLGKIISQEYAAKIIGSHFPEIEDKLLNTLQLEKLIIKNPNQKILIEASIAQKIDFFKAMKFVSAVKLKENKKYFKYIVFPISIFILLALISPWIIKDGANRMIHFSTFYKKTAPYEIIILNKNLMATEGEDFILDIKVKGNEIPNDIFLDDGLNTFKLKYKNFSLI